MSAVNSYPNVDADDILEAIAQFYSFFERMQQLRNDIEDLAVDDQKKIRILDQLEGVESECVYSLCFCLCVCGFSNSTKKNQKLLLEAHSIGRAGTCTCFERMLYCVH